MDATAETNQTISIGPQPGPQEAFLATSADIAIYGGAAGGGKSFALLLEPLRHYSNPKFGAVIFRRTSVQVRNKGGLWDESQTIYMPLGGVPRQANLDWFFPSGMSVKFTHLENDASVYDWQGSQIPLIGFDELTHFTEKQFWYMLSRNRSTSGVAGYVRASTNPDYNSWVRRLIDWWIGPDGYPIKERSGIVRWFIRQDDTLIWGDSREELEEKYGKDSTPKSLTFIPSKLDDNKILMQKDPAYRANLNALSRVERMRLRDGNWNVRATSGMYFQRDWFEVIDVLPSNSLQVIRYWDKAATRPSEENKDPDYTAGVKLHKYPQGQYVVSNVVRTRDTPLKVEQFVKNTASQDGYSVAIGIEQEPGSSGVADANNYVRLLAGFDVRVRRPSTDKETRALPVSAQCEHGNIKLLRGPWNDDFLNELENFNPEEDSGHDDQVDGLSGAFNELFEELSILDAL